MTREYRKGRLRDALSSADDSDESAELMVKAAVELERKWVPVDSCEQPANSEVYWVASTVLKEPELMVYTENPASGLCWRSVFGSLSMKRATHFMHVPQPSMPKG